MTVLRLVIVACLAAVAARGATSEDRLHALRAKLAEQNQAGRPPGWKKEVQFAASLKNEPQLGARLLFDVAQAQMRQSARYAVPTLKQLLESFPDAQPWAGRAAYRLARLHEGSTAGRKQALKYYHLFLEAPDRGPARTARALVEVAELESEAGQHDEALERLRALLDRFPGYDKLRAEALERMGRIHVARKDIGAAGDAARRLAEEYPWAVQSRADLLYAIVQAHRGAEDHEATVDACERFLEAIRRHTYERQHIYAALGEAYRELDNPEAAEQTFRRMLDDPALDSDDRQRARQYLFAHYRRVDDHPAIIREAHRLIAMDPRTAAESDDLLRALVEALIKEGRTDEAMAMARADYQLARLAFDPREQRRRRTDADDAVFTVVRALKAKEGSLRSANAFINYIETGPAGPDGKMGTKDDRTNPAADTRLPPNEDRDRLFAEAEKRLAAEPLKRACLYVCWDKPAQALHAFRIHYLRTTGEDGVKNAANIVAQAMRALDRPEEEADAFFDFQNYGPNGKDGKPKTKDDLTDPILDLQ
jgi:tetratricopeptide (TPR) repeat protein